MQAVVFEPLRWQDAPSRVTVSSPDDHPRVLYQVTAPLKIASLAIGRPVEELPRIAGIMGAAHHLAAVRALDRIFEVTPPPPAENMRRSLLLAVTLAAHLQKVYFLMSAMTNPFAGLRSVARQSGPTLASHGLLDDIMHTVALAQEAAAILGGRSAHPITAIAGGVSRYLKEDQYQRLAEIAATCLPAVVRISETVRGILSNSAGGTAQPSDLTFGPMASVTLSASTSDPAQKSVRLQSASGEIIDRFDTEQLGQKIVLRQESWTHAPFAVFEDAGWQGLPFDNNKGLYFVGPLARLNSGDALETQLADKERERLIAARGPFPHFDVTAAFWSLLVEALQAAESMQSLYAEDNFIGPSIRKVPTQMGTEGQAAVESPDGMIYHHYLVNAEGIVEACEVIDTAAENNALRCRVSQKTVENARQRKGNWKQIKARLELNLLPF